MLTVDWHEYENHLAVADLTDDEKREFIEALWYIVVSFVDLGFGIAPVQQAMMAAASAGPALPAPSAAKIAEDSEDASTTDTPKHTMEIVPNEKGSTQ